MGLVTHRLQVLGLRGLCCLIRLDMLTLRQFVVVDLDGACARGDLPLTPLL